MPEERAATPFTTKLLAAVVLIVAAWILLRVVINVTLAITWIVVALLAVIGLVWAIRTLRAP